MGVENKAIEDIATSPPDAHVSPDVTCRFEYTSISVAFASPAMDKHDVIHKPEVHNVLHCCHRRIEPRPQVTCIENFVKSGRVVLRYVTGNTFRHVDTLIVITVSETSRRKSFRLRTQDAAKNQPTSYHVAIAIIATCLRWERRWYIAQETSNVDCRTLVLCRFAKFRVVRVNVVRRGCVKMSRQIACYSAVVMQTFKKNKSAVIYHIALMHACWKRSVDLVVICMNLPADIFFTFYTVSRKKEYYKRYALKRIAQPNTTKIVAEQSEYCFDSAWKFHQNIF